jgi:hypothetical protein
VYIGFTEIQHSDDDRVFEREKCHTDTLGSFEGNERVYEQEFLDTGVLCESGSAAEEESEASLGI